ncbi:hypothetical protein JCM19233_6181 [Vibrio astriarenae]|nr:hypothetical protein JCM19233_6181 [Vibrio sp. C7]
MGELLNNNKAANSIYQKFIGDEPLSMPHSAEAISKVTLDIMRSMHMVAMTLCIAFLGYRILSVGLTMMNDNNKSLNDLWKWSDFAVVALAVLSLPTRDGVGFGVLGLVALVLFMMSQSIYVASFVYPLIFPSSTNLINGSETDVFANTSDEYATSLIKGISTAQDSAVYGAFLSVDTEGATLLTDNATSSSGFFGSVWNFFNRETRDPSFAEVYEGVFSDYSLVLRMQAPRAGKNSSTNIELYSGKAAEDGSTKSPLFMQAFSQNSIFSQANVFSVGHTAPSLDGGAFKLIADSKSLQNISERSIIYGDEEAVKKAAQAVGKEFFNLIHEARAVYPDAHPSAIVNAAQGFLLGAYSVQATREGKSTVRYNAFAFENLYERGEQEPFFKVLGLTQNALDTSRKVQCVKNLPNAGYEIEAFFRLREERGGDTDTEFRKVSQQPHIYPVCAYPTADPKTPDLLLSEEAKNKAFAIYRLVSSGVDEVTLEQRLADLQRELEFGVNGEEPEITGLVEQAQQQLSIVANYYALIGSGSRFAVAEFIGAEDSEANQQQDIALREKGVLGLPMGFISSSARMNAFNDAVYAAHPQAGIAVGRDDATGWLPRRVLEQEEVRQKNAIPLNRDIAALFGGDSGISATTKAETTQADEIADSLVLNAVNYLIPDSDIFSQRMGFERSNLAASLVGCSTTDSCIKFTGHPVHAVIEFSVSLFSGGVTILVIDAIFQNLNSMYQSMTGSGEPDGGVFDQGLNMIKKAVSTAIPLVKAIGVLLMVGAVITGILAKLGMLGLIAGAFGSVIMPTQILFAYIKLILESLVMIMVMMISLPVLLVMCIPRVDGEPLLSPYTVLKSALAAALSIPFLVISFMVFVGTSFVSVYLSNSIGGVIMVTVMDGGAGSIMTAIYAILSVIVWLGMVIFSILASLKISCSVTGMLQKALGIDNAAGQLTDDLGSVFAVAAITSRTKIAHSMSSGLGAKVANKLGFKGRRGADSENAARQGASATAGVSRGAAETTSQPIEQQANTEVKSEPKQQSDRNLGDERQASKGSKSDGGNKELPEEPKTARTGTGQQVEPEKKDSE